LVSSRVSKGTGRPVAAPGQRKFCYPGVPIQRQEEKSRDRLSKSRPGPSRSKMSKFCPGPWQDFELCPLPRGQENPVPLETLVSSVNLALKHSKFSNWSLFFLRIRFFVICYILNNLSGCQKSLRMFVGNFET
jgi:hypothetical protein